MSDYLSPREEIIKTDEEFLPHWQQGEVMQFVTFRLVDSVPQSMVAQLKEEKWYWMQHHPEPWSDDERLEYWERFHDRLDRVLDGGLGSCVLKAPQNRLILELVFDAGDGDAFDLHAWVIMPNHVHLLFSPQRPVSELVKIWKGVSARRIGSGPIWQRNYYDRMIRDVGHFCSVVRYIRRNPKGLPAGTYSLWESERVREVQ